MTFIRNEWIWTIDRFLEQVKGATLKGFLDGYSMRQMITWVTQAMASIFTAHICAQMFQTKEILATVWVRQDEGNARHTTALSGCWFDSLQGSNIPIITRLQVSKCASHFTHLPSATEGLSGSALTQQHGLQKQQGGWGGGGSSSWPTVRQHQSSRGSKWL